MARDGGRLSSMGWLPDYPSQRDYSVNHASVNERLGAVGQPPVKTMLAKVKAAKTTTKLPAKTDLREWCSPVEDQGNIGSCTANAGCGLVEYFERRAFGRHLDASRLFLYKATRNLMRVTGDTGGFLRTTMEAMTAFGVPPEEYWPYNTEDFDVEPTAFCYAFGQSYQAVSYYRLDPLGTKPEDLLTRIKTNLAKGLPAMFGFTVYQSYEQSNDNGGKFPIPTNRERVSGGHAVDAVGYDDKMKVKNANTGGVETTGALLVRNSWGTGWGEAGYGWLPYEYVLRGLATDWWSVLKAEWLNTGNFD